MNRFPTRLSTVAAAALAMSLAGCSTVESFIGGDRLDYRSQAGKTAPLEVPPDLSQLSRDGRFQPQATGTVSASTLQTAATAPAAGTAAAGAAVAPTSIGAIRIERAGDQRWLVTSMPAEQVWPQLLAFWQERGFTLAIQDAQAGIIETDWAENRAKLPEDIVRRTIGKVFDNLYSTGERDKFRTRLERTPAGSEIYLVHKGLEEVYTGQNRDNTQWTNRKPDPQLEAEFLSRLMVKLGAKEDVARQTVTSSTGAAGGSAQPARARLLAGESAALEVDEAFDRAWRRVGLVLDRGGFTVEDRDRTGGLYYVRYVDPKTMGRDEPGWFSRMFSFGRDNKDTGTANRYRIAVKGEGDKTTVRVQNNQGAPENGDVGKRIVSLLVDELK